MFCNTNEKIVVNYLKIYIFPFDFYLITPKNHPLKQKQNYKVYCIVRFNSSHECTYFSMQNFQKTLFYQGLRSKKNRYKT